MRLAKLYERGEFAASFLGSQQLMIPTANREKGDMPTDHVRLTHVFLRVQLRVRPVHYSPFRSFFRFALWPLCFYFARRNGGLALAVVASGSGGCPLPAPRLTAVSRLIGVQVFAMASSEESRRP